ncbi:MAG: hypothetical protein ACW99J_19850 [Candidatus Thorarchaeota archaeon]|jgi:hypothetical protein
MAKAIPLQGDPIPDGHPSVTKWVKVTFGATHGDVQYSTAATVFDLITFPQYTMIEDVLWRVETAFTANVDLSLGNTDDADGWAEVADIGATVASTNLSGASIISYLSEASSDTVTTAPALAGIGLINDSGAYTLQVTQATAEPAVGMLEVYVKYNNSFLQTSTEI